jgi:hypothetical protein
MLPAAAPVSSSCSPSLLTQLAAPIRSFFFLPFEWKLHDDGCPAQEHSGEQWRSSTKAAEHNVIPVFRLALRTASLPQATLNRLQVLLQHQKIYY